MNRVLVSLVEFVCNALSQRLTALVLAGVESSSVPTLSEWDSLGCTVNLFKMVVF